MQTSRSTSSRCRKQTFRMEPWLCVAGISLLLLSSHTLSCDDVCREMTFLGLKFFAGKRLVEHVIRTEQVWDKDLCQLRCYLEHNCVSFNFKVKTNAEGTFSCELNNATHLEQNGHFINTKDYDYQGGENYCGHAPCRNNGTCQSGFTTKRYRCLCLPGYDGEHCENAPSSIDSVILSANLLPAFQRFFEPVIGSSGKWELCYRASDHGWASKTFHVKCDGKMNTVTIIKSASYVFGGYTDIAWDSSDSYGNTSNAFIFSLLNSENLLPFKTVVTVKSQAIFKGESKGPTFGGGHDLFVDLNNPKEPPSSHTKLGHSYKPTVARSKLTLLAGSFNFVLDEVEVFFLA
ncbi:uncharacterized protein [Acropora muricata]|uniref:uncharacterized protein n=1 Tax=Acropora muricata TaxID=159855 RepID=UPI0034E45E93